MNRKKFSALLAGLLVLSLTLSSGILHVAAENQADRAIEVTVLFFNDLHGNLQPLKVNQDGQSVEVGGFARLAAAVKNIREENDRQGIRTLLLVAGDMLQGTPMSTVFKGQADMDCFNALGVDAMTVGNHEFDFGLDNFLSLKDKAKFPIISSNIVWQGTDQLFVQPTATFPLTDKITLTVIAATTRELLTSTSPANVEKVKVLDSTRTVPEIYQRVKKDGPVILLSHSRFETDAAIAKAVPQLTAIIGGHDQILFNPYRQVGEVPVFQAFEKGRYLGRIDLSIDPGTKKASIRNWAYLAVTADIKPDPQIDQIIAGYSSRLDASFKEVIGTAGVFLDGERSRIRYEETNLGDFVADVMREYTRADVALINSGGLRASIDAGPVTMESVFRVMPYANEILILSLSGRDLQTALSRSVSQTREDEDGGFLHVSGVRFLVRGKAVEDVTVGDDKKPLDSARKYKVAITDFMAAGGDGYDVLKDKPTTDSGSPLRELLITTIRGKGTIEPKVDGRITRLDQ